MSKIIKKINSILNSKVSSWLLLTGFFFMIAAASNSGFMDKHGLRDGDARSSAIKMMQGEASKPFVYRQLVPIIANSVQHFVDNSNKNIFSKLIIKLNKREYYSVDVLEQIKGHEHGYFTFIILNFTALFLSLFVLRALLLKLNFSHYESILAPSIFIIAFPYLQTVGGYFYDSVELAFFSLALLLAAEGQLVALAIISLFAALNKESFLFFIPTLYPILRDRYTVKKTLMFLGFAMFIAGLVKLYLKAKYMANNGGEFEFWLFRNINQYSTPSTYFKFEPTYQLVGPHGFSMIFIIITFIIIMRGINYLPTIWKKHIQIALIINIPLFLALCWVGELRNLSMLYGGFVLLIAGALRATHLNSNN